MAPAVGIVVARVSPYSLSFSGGKSEMISHIRGRPEIISVASNPMLLTTMCIIYDEGKPLP